MKLLLNRKELDNSNGDGGLEITIEGYVGDPQQKSPGTAIFLEYYEGKLLAHVWDGTKAGPGETGSDPVTHTFVAEDRLV